MADNAPVPEDASKPPALPTTPPLKSAASKVVVALSSVAKAPPPIPIKQASAEPKLVQPGIKTEIKPPPKIETLRGAPPIKVPDTSSPETGRGQSSVPPLVNSGSKKTTARLLIPSIKLNQPVPEPVVEKETPQESIILGPGDSVEEHPVHPEKVAEEKAASSSSAEQEKLPEAAQSLVVLPPVAPVAGESTTLQPPVILSKPESSEAPKSVRPPPLPAPKPVEKAASTAVQVVPKMVGAEPIAHGEKLRPPPQLPQEGAGVAGALPHPVVVPETTALPRVPALAPVEAKSGGTLPPALPSTSAAVTPTEAKVVPPILPSDKAAAPIGTTKALPPPIDPLLKATKQLLPKREEAKPALRPAVLPNKALANPKTTSSSIEPLVVAGSTKKTAAAVPPIAAAQPETGKLHAPVEIPAKTTDKPPLPLTRAARAKKRRVMEMVFFYFVMLVVGGVLYVGTIRLTQETRVEGQVIPPAGMPLAEEVWIVSDFRQLTAGIAEDLAEERAPLLQEMHERQDHVQRVQADLAMREERIRLLRAQIQSAKDEETNVVKQARDEAQQLWDGPGTQLDDDYNARQSELQNAIVNRAKSLNLKYAPDPTYNAPEVWANAYRLALYEVPAGVDAGKEYQWLNDQMKAWRDFVKAQDDKREQLREQAAQIKMSPATKLNDLNAKIEELQHRIDSTQSEEDPLKPELQTAQADLAETQTTEAGLDAKYYKQLSALPGSSITKRLPLEPNGRFTWANVENDSPFADGENEHHYWIFSRATRADGREYWALGRFTIEKNHTLGLLIEPDSFVSTKAMLRPELSPDEQAQ